ncbi:phage tail protein [Xanthobacteraceae bacterium Astr-EGSB]|uniref:phage tail protein n=1 Tax=Astrobacterium formosum TaxID=3069710 RepID=UPI0027B7F7B3|nr:phage tail protein [Xanthobacteraceae bacterium Astr-EGSB]
MTTFLIAMVMLSASTAAAAADPISITAAVVTALLPATGATLFTIGATTITIAQAIATAVVVGGSIALSSILSPSGQNASSVNPTDAKSTFESAEAPELRAIGRVRIGGLKIFGATNGDNRWRVIANSRGPISGDITHYLGGREVLVDPDGTVQSPPWVHAGVSWVQVHSKPGDGSETAWPQLISEFPSIWTADHRVRGIAQTLLLYISPGLQNDLFLKLYQSGPPEYERVQAGEPLYDPRIGATAWSDNGILACLHIALTFDELSLADFDMPFVAAEATKADELVATLTGTEKRSRLWGIWSSETPRATVLAEALMSAGAEIVPRPGDKLGIRLVDDDPDPEITLPLRHIIDIKTRSGPEAVERPNVCIVKYYSPEREYSITEIDMTGIGWAKIDDEVDRFGTKTKTVELKMCPSAAQAQRIARRIFALARSDQGVVVTNWVGVSAWGCRTAAIEFPDLDMTATCAISPPRIDDGAGAVEIPFAVFPGLTAWNPAVDEAAAPTPTPDLALFGGLPQPAVPWGAGVVPGKVRLAYVLPAGATIAEAQFRVYSGATPGSWTSMSETSSAAIGTHATAAGTFAGAHLEFRVRGFDDDGNGSNFSPYLDVLFAAPDPVAPAAPAISKTPIVTEGITGFRIDITAPTGLNVHTIVATGPGAPETPYVVEPGQMVDITHYGADDTWTAQAFNGAGLGSAIVTT